MKILRLSTLLYTLFFLVSCEKDRKNVVISNHVEITILNQQGQNLLATPSAYTKSNINVYYFVNGQPQLYNQPNFQADKGFLLFKDGSGIDKIRVFTDFNENQPTTLSLIKFGNLQTDTIKCEYRFEDGSVFLEKIWYNGVAQPSPYFSIIK